MIDEINLHGCEPAYLSMETVVLKINEIINALNNAESLASTNKPQNETCHCCGGSGAEPFYYH